MRELHLKGTSIGVHKLEKPTEEGSTYRLLIVDGVIDGAGNLEPGSGSGEIIWVYMDDPATAALHEQTEGASKVLVPGQPKMTVIRERKSVGR